MNIVALIPARGGSKRLLNKNIKLLGGTPLINWSIQTAQKITEISEVLVSTDSPEIAKIAKEAGATVPWLRPMHLALDDSSSADVGIHSLIWFGERNIKVDGILLLQPTSPFRKSETIRRGIQLFIENKKSPVIGVKPIHNPHLSIYLKKGDFIYHVLDNQLENGESKNNYFEVTGGFYLISPEDLFETKTFVNSTSIPLIMKDEETIDIDTEWDFEIAQNYILNKRNQKYMS